MTFFGPVLAFTLSMGRYYGEISKALLCILFLAGQTALAEGITNLPVGVWSPMLLFGVIDGLDQTYKKDGKLTTLRGDTSIVLDADALVKLAPEAKKAISVINATGNQNLGDKLHLGVIDIDVKPQVSYYSPILAYGVNRRLTLGLGVPMVTYRADVNVSHYGSNVGQFSQAFSGLNDELDDAFVKMNQISSEFQQEIVNKGYKPLTSRNESFMGDLILNAQYILWGNKRNRLLSKTYLNLPTGPAYDPDDLLALNMFGKTSITQDFVAGRRITRRFTLAGKVGFKFGIPDEIVARVPADEDDLLPGLETKETVKRQTGMTTTFKIAPSFDITNALSVSASAAFSTKGKDSFTGGRGQRYDLLEKDTDGSSTTTSLGLSYSTVDAFSKKKFIIPFIVSYDYTDTIAGRNTEKQTTHELNLTLFYK